MSAPKVLIVVVTYNKKKYVTDLLDSLSRIDYTNYDVVVVDNASTDGTVGHLAERFPAAKLIAKTVNDGGSGGFNSGLGYAFAQEGYEYYWLLDNDVVVAEDALSKLVAVLDTRDDIAVAGSQMCQLDNPEVTNEIGAYVDLNRGGLILNRHMTRRRNNLSGIFDVDYAAAASMLVRADVAKKAGLWEDFFIHFDDVEWCLRIKEMGHRVVGVADSVIWHLSAAEKPLTWTRYYDVRNMLFLLKKHGTDNSTARFLRRKCLQAVQLALKGLTPAAELILDAVEDFQKGRKGGRPFRLPQSLQEDLLRASHPAKDVLIVQNEWFDVKKFPCEKELLGTVKGIMLPPNLADADCYWRRSKDVPVVVLGRMRKLLLLAAGIFGYRRYSRIYMDIRYPTYVSLLADEVGIKINDEYWLLKGDRLTVWNNLFTIGRKSARNFFGSFFMGRTT